MSKTCKNCDHYKICEEYWNDICVGDIVEMKEYWGNDCDKWSGWHDAKEELPEKDYTGVLVVLAGNVKDVACWDKEHGFRPWYAGFYEEVPPEWEREIVAWRELPEYEEDK